MRKIAVAIFAILVSQRPAPAQEGGDEQRFWAAAFETARVYAQDMTLISYCVRKDEELAAYVPVTVVADLNHVAEQARTGAISARRIAAFIREVLSSVRFAEREANDGALDRKCAEQKVADQILKLGPIAWPLSMRPPFSNGGAK